MPHALLKLSSNASRALDVVKAKYHLKDKAEAVEMLVNKYIEDSGDPELRPEFLEELIKARKGPFIRVKDVDGLFSRNSKKAPKTARAAQRARSRKG
jgi:hypothetical protein